MSAQAAEANTLTRKLWHIAGTGDLEQFERLLDQGADVNAGDRTGVTALMRAAYHGQLAMVRALIEHGADPNAADRSGLTALTMAKHAGHQEIVDVLLTFGSQNKKATKPRRVVPAVEEEISPAPNHEATPSKTPPVKTPPELPDNHEPMPSKISAVRTLQEPPDIWDMVHTTQPNSDLPAPVPAKPVSKRAKRALAAGVVALIICVGVVFGLMSLRGVWTGDKTPEPQAKAPALEPTSSANEWEAVVKALTGGVGSVTPAVNDLTKIKDVGRLPAVLPVKKSSSNKRMNAAALLSKQDRNVIKPIRLESDSDFKSVRKEQPPPPVDQVKPTVLQKPKVIQWP